MLHLVWGTVNGGHRDRFGLGDVDSRKFTYTVISRRSRRKGKRNKQLFIPLIKFKLSSNRFLHESKSGKIFKSIFSSIRKKNAEPTERNYNREFSRIRRNTCPWNSLQWTTLPSLPPKTKHPKKPNSPSEKLVFRGNG